MKQKKAGAISHRRACVLPLNRILSFLLPAPQLLSLSLTRQKKKPTQIIDHSGRRLGPREFARQTGEAAANQQANATVDPGAARLPR